MKNNKKSDSELAKLSLDEIPVPSADAVTITGLVKHHGRICGYQLSDERIVDRDNGVALAKSGGIRGVGIAHRKNTEYLKTIPDENEGNNLSTLPSISAKELIH